MPTGLPWTIGTSVLLVWLGLWLVDLVLERRGRVRRAAWTRHRVLLAATEAARAEAARANELLQDQAVELEQQLEATQAVAAENESLLAESQAINEALQTSLVALQSSEERFRGLVEAAHEGVWALDAAGCTTYVNPRMAALLGIDAAALVGRSFFDYLDASSAFEARTRFARPQRGLADAQELTFRRLDGTPLVGLVALSPLPDATGAIRGVLVLVHDATEQKHAELALRESEARFRELFERNPLPMWVYDPETLGFLDVNEAAIRRYGWTREDFLGMTLDDVSPPEHHGLLSRAIAPLRATRWLGRLFVGQVVHRAKDGRYFDVEVTSDAVAFGSRTARISLLNDVTERVAAQRALQSSNERFSYVQRATNDVIWDRDLLTDRIVWSGGMHTTLRYADGDVASPSSWWQDRLHPEDRERVLDTVQGVLLCGDDCWDVEYRFRRGDGTYAHVLDRGYALRDGTGTPIRLIGAMQDLSERESLAAQLRQAQRLETVGRLAGGVAHDFNNLLTVITANTEFARAELPTTSPAARDLVEVLDAARRAEALTRQLLTFSRKQVWQPQVVDVNRTVDALHRMLDRLIGEDVSLGITLAPDMWPVFVDPGQLEQVLANLIVNARDAMPNGGSIQLTTATLSLDAATLHAYGAAGVVRVQPPLPMLAPGDYVALSVVDSGTGIAADVLPHIFEPFFTTKPEGEGTGLGLATVYGIVQQASGAILVSSTVGVGTRVTVLLPRDRSRATDAVATTPEPTAPPRGREMVLLVEDEPAVRAVVHRTLTRAGYSVVEAAHGAEALTLWRGLRARGEGVDVVLTDAVMPVLGGHALAEHLRAEAPEIRIVLMSGYTAETAGGDAALARGAASAFLQKPLTGATLLRTLRQVLDA
jgi:two-component system cell cycle sensor histidine kinase/response regulator CckA